MKANVIVVLVGNLDFTLIRCPIQILTRNRLHCVVGNKKIRRLQLDGCSCSRLIGPCCHDCIFSVPMQSHNASTNHHVLSKGGHDDAITKATSAGCAFGKGLSVERVVVA